jgi:zinc protease
MPTSPIRIVVAGSLLVVFAGCASDKAAKRQGVEMPPVQFAMRSLTYPSGLRVLVERDARTRLAGVFLVVGAGSSGDPAGKEGVAHLVEHLAYRSRPTDGRPFRNLLEEAGAFHYNAFTEFDETVYYELGLASELPELLRVEGARMLDPVSHVPDGVFRAERDVVENELRQDNETGYAGDVLREIQEAVFPKGHPYQRPVIGTLQSLDTLGVSDVQAFVRSHYRPDNMTLLVLGDVDLETADRLIAASLPRELLQAPSRVQIPQRMPKAAPLVPASPPGPSRLERKTAPVSMPQIWIGWSLPRSFDTDGYLLAFVKGAAQQRLSRVAFEDKDVARVRVNVIPGLQASLLVCQVVLHENVHPEQTRDRILAEVPRIWETGSHLAEELSEYAFSVVRRVVTVAEVSAAQDLVARGIKRATISHFSQDPAVYSRAVRDLTAMRRKQLSDFAAPYLTKERARAVLFVPRAGTLAASAQPVGEMAEVLEMDPDADASTATIGRAEGVDASKVGDRLRRLFTEGDGATTTRLPNGLTVIVQRRPGLPLVSAGLLLPAVRGSLEESAAAEVAWIAARPEHLHNGAPEMFGGLIRRTRPAESIVYWVEGASGNAEILLAILAEYTRSMSVGRVDWASVRRFLAPFWKRSEEDPRTVATRKLYASLLRGTTYRPLPTLADLERASPDAVKGWIQRTHSPASATLAIVGDVDLTDVARWVETSFGSWSGPAPSEAPPPKLAVAAPSASSPADERVLVTDRPGATQTRVEFACLLPRVGDGATAARLAIGAAVLQERLTRVEREDLGATYGPSVFAATRRGGEAFLEVGSMVEPGKLAPALAGLKRTLASVGAQPVSADEVAAAKMRLASRAAAAQMTNLGIVWSHLTRMRMGYALSGPDAAADFVAVSPEDVRSGFQFCLQGNPVLSLVGEEKAVRAAVQAGWR